MGKIYRTYEYHVNDGRNNYMYSKNVYIPQDSDVYIERDGNVYITNNDMNRNNTEMEMQRLYTEKCDEFVDNILKLDNSVFDDFIERLKTTIYDWDDLRLSTYRSRLQQHYSYLNNGSSRNKSSISRIRKIYDVIYDEMTKRQRQVDEDREEMVTETVRVTKKKFVKKEEKKEEAKKPYTVDDISTEFPSFNESTFPNTESNIFDKMIGEPA